MPESAAFIKLLRAMGHDMRVPLNTLISTSDMLVQGVYDPLTPKQEKAVTRMQRNSYRLLAMLDDFVTYMKAESGELLLTTKPFSPRLQLNAWCDEVRSTASEKGFVLLLNAADDVPETLIGDETIIKRMVLALLWNAVTHTTQGEISVMSGWTAEHGWHISVTDTGSGISDSDLPHIFEPFWRGEERPLTPTAGAGLGLPLSLALAKAMGGALSLDATSAAGSSFSLHLPFNV